MFLPFGMAAEARYSVRKSIKERIARVAAMKGQSLTSFMLDARPDCRLLAGAVPTMVD